MCDTELIRSSLTKIQTALGRILKRSETILSPDDFLTTQSGVERLERSYGNARHYSTSLFRYRCSYSF